MADDVVLMSETIVVPVNMLDPIRKRFGYGQLWPLRPACTARIGPDRICQIRPTVSVSVPFFQRHGSYCAKPTRIRCGWPGQGLTKHIWSGSKPVCRNHPARFWQDATGPLPVSHLQTRFRSSTGVPDNNLLFKTSPDPI